MTVNMFYKQEYTSLALTDRHALICSEAGGIIKMKIKSIDGLPYPVLDILLDYESLERFRSACEETLGTYKLVTRKFRNDTVVESHTEITFKGLSETGCLIIGYPKGGREYPDHELLPFTQDQYQKLIESMYKHIDKYAVIKKRRVEPYLHS